ncbi:hypothetical protein BJY52DRAFT_1228086 [Lactarius psammicola]|nr:hypothetical protein BJY52DRAFT_1228086 [Lactarius psammicola]
MLGANVNAIPAPPPQSAIIIGTDSLWGAHEWTIYPQPYHHEFPYLAWIPMSSPNPFIPSNVLTHSIEKTMWQAHSHKPNTWVINPTLFGKLSTLRKTMDKRGEEESKVEKDKEGFKHEQEGKEVE